MNKYILTRLLLPSVLALVALAPFASSAQTKNPPTSVGQAAWFEMSTINGTSIDLNSFKGKVVLIFNWSTNCSVCLDKIMELRDNTAGWKNKPFALVAVNHDPKQQDYQDYVRIAGALKTTPAQMQFVYFKDVTSDSLFRTASPLPQTFLIDDKGVLRHIFTVRMTPQAWDQIAELIP